ncbi:hypothetical protein B296_00026195 [Ensete ventricosum]|uniref:Uncharacterized protein n=1 Tax=Ensete ventricosum TaxID=4639 RepID=A0A426XN94_ENSVE|nr:hypothetical protein B296_00026195 [Ensete ventricosum]
MLDQRELSARELLAKIRGFRPDDCKQPFSQDDRQPSIANIPWPRSPWLLELLADGESYTKGFSSQQWLCSTKGSSWPK